MVWSSFEVLALSLKLGDGESFGVESERDRCFDGDFDGVRTAKTEPLETMPSSMLASLCSRSCSDNLLASMASMDVVEPVVGAAVAGLRRSKSFIASWRAFALADDALYRWDRLRVVVGRLVGLNHCVERAEWR